MLWLQHAGLLYVDDFFFIFPRSVALILATLLCIASQAVRLPISWGKCEFGAKLKWIGWHFYVLARYLALPEDKLQKLADQLKELRRSDRCPKKSLEKAVGLLNWLAQVFILMRTWLPYLYKDLFSIPASHYSVDSGSWQSVMECLDDDLIFQSQPRGLGIPVGSKLLAVRHQSVQCKADLASLYLSETTFVVATSRLQSSKRKLSDDSLRVIQMYLDWISATSVVKSLFPRQLWQGECAADACAYSNICQIGGFVRFPTGTTVWFSCRFEHSDFQALNIPVTSEMQKFIACFETLAQIAILLIFSRNSPGYRFPLRFPSLTDNSGTESGGNKLFSTTFPMNLFLEKLTILCTISGMELDLSHIAGDRNDEADALSRWDLTSVLHLVISFATVLIFPCKIFGCLFVPSVYILLIHIYSGILRESALLAVFHLKILCSSVNSRFPSFFFRLPESNTDYGVVCAFEFQRSQQSDSLYGDCDNHQTWLQKSPHKSHGATAR